MGDTPLSSGTPSPHGFLSDDPLPTGMTVGEGVRVPAQSPARMNVQAVRL
ncbi:MAG TPA: hypothetical protein VHQ47_15345 [Phycisphaerae bacterium]|jgi:hypothetical protein|nr:hypothetical protein [Phycisphaerae bacterium]